tara:strand:+ start:326 stop:559 length:234 start_codon:yes stop_codon:yes gene_type:complete
MSSDIEIKEGEFSDLSIEVKASSISIWTKGCPIGEWEDGTALLGVTFDLKDSDDRQAIKNLIWHLQHQLEVHKENEE